MKINIIVLFFATAIGSVATGHSVPGVTTSASRPTKRTIYYKEPITVYRPTINTVQGV